MFYLITITNDTKKEITEFNSFDEALAVFHGELANRTKGRKSTKCVILNAELLTIKQEKYKSLEEVKED